MYNIVTIPQKIAKQGDLVVMPRKEYEECLFYKKMASFNPSLAEKKAVKEGRKKIKKGECLTFQELKNEMGI